MTATKNLGPFQPMGLHFTLTKSNLIRMWLFERVLAKLKLVLVIASGIGSWANVSYTFWRPMYTVAPVVNFEIWIIPSSDDPNQMAWETVVSRQMVVIVNVQQMSRIISKGRDLGMVSMIGGVLSKKKKKTGGCTRCSSSCNNLNKWRLTHPFSFECAWEGKALLETSYLELNSSEFIVKRVLIVEGIQVRVLEGTITFLNFNLLGSWWVFISYQRENIWWPRVNMNL